MTFRTTQWQREQFEAIEMVRQCCHGFSAVEIDHLKTMTASYLLFRKELDAFLSKHFSGICSSICWEKGMCPCCSKDGIIAFFADVVVNFLHAEPARMRRLAVALERENSGMQCACLGQNGCLWGIRPIVCAMFLCDRAEKEVFEGNPTLRNEWKTLTDKKKRFTWPDRPVLFDDLERYFMDKGLSSSLMYLHNSPGLLKVKKMRG